MDTAACLADTAFRLGFTGVGEIGVSSWVTTAELYQFADDAAKKLAYRSALFIQNDTSVTTLGSQATGQLALQDNHIYTLAASFVDGITGSVTALRLTTVRDLWALDGHWSVTTADVPNRCSLDAGSVGTINLYPNPNHAGTVSQICQEYPATLASGASTISAPTVLQDYFTYAELAGARGKESDFRQGDMADHYSQRMAMYEAIVDQYWGPGQ